MQMYARFKAWLRTPRDQAPGYLTCLHVYEEICIVYFRECDMTLCNDAQISM